MTDGQSAEEILVRIETVLVEERQLLLSGRVHDMAGLIGEKTGAMEAFDALLRESGTLIRRDTFQARLKGVVQTAKENAQHFQAVQNGLRNVMNRLGRVTQDSYVGAYQSNGLQTPFTKATGNYFKKA